MQFTDERELESFDGWLRYQAAANLSDADLAVWRSIYEAIEQRKTLTPKIGVMSLSTGSLYAVAVEDDGLWIAAWIRRSPRGHIFVLAPGVNPSGWHLSYHQDGRFHHKDGSGYVVKEYERRQPLSERFSGREDLGMYYGNAPRSVGAICEPERFDDVIRVPRGVLGPRHGCIAIELLGADAAPADSLVPGQRLVEDRVYSESIPAIHVRVLATADP